MSTGFIFAKIDVELRDHEKAQQAGEAMATWTWCMLWTRAKERDGFVSKEAIRGSWVGEKVAARHMTTLVKVGLAETVDGGWELTGYSAKNETKADIDERRYEQRTRKARFDSKKRDGNALPVVEVTRYSRVHNATETETETETKLETEKKKKPSVSKKSATATPPDGFDPVASCAEWLKNKGVSRRDAESQLEKFLDDSTAKGRVYADWNAAFRKWIGNAIDWGNVEVSPETKVVSLPKRTEESGPSVAISEAEYNQLFDGIVRTGHAS